MNTVTKIVTGLCMIAATSNAVDTTVVLQNSDTYKGCQDSYVYKSNWKTGEDAKNHYTEPDLRLHDEGC
ncbi:MAG: hypothetical protein JW795_13350 [Chitinivibrionales bacterium]|nr:hypothetical protein [Chitinivibrionales bacterium]